MPWRDQKGTSRTRPRLAKLSPGRVKATAFLGTQARVENAPQTIEAEGRKAVGAEISGPRRTNAARCPRVGLGGKRGGGGKSTLAFEYSDLRTYAVRSPRIRGRGGPSTRRATHKRIIAWEPTRSPNNGAVAHAPRYPRAVCQPKPDPVTIRRPPVVRVRPSQIREGTRVCAERNGAPPAWRPRAHYRCATLPPQDQPLRYEVRDKGNRGLFGRVALCALPASLGPDVCGVLAQDDV